MSTLKEVEKIKISIRKVLDQIHPGMIITGQTLTVICEFLINVFSILKEYSNKNNLEDCVRTLFGESELLQYAIREGKKASESTRYNSGLVFEIIEENIYFTAVIEYLTAEIIELSGNLHKSRGENKIRKSSFKKIINCDHEIDILYTNVKNYVKIK
jgi:hypothetical protein